MGGKGDAVRGCSEVHDTPQGTEDVRSYSVHLRRGLGASALTKLNALRWKKTPIDLLRSMRSLQIAPIIVKAALPPPAVRLNAAGRQYAFRMHKLPKEHPVKIAIGTQQTGSRFRRAPNRLGREPAGENEGENRLELAIQWEGLMGSSGGYRCCYASSSTHTSGCCDAVAWVDACAAEIWIPRHTNIKAHVRHGGAGSLSISQSMLMAA